MTYSVRYIIPDVQYEARRAGDQRPFYLEWHSEHNLSQIVPPLDNIRFEHDADWDSRFFSIQSARDGNHPAWKVAHVVATIGPILWL